jgi:hypothetical protein
VYKGDLMQYELKRAEKKSRLGSRRGGRPATAMARADGEL